MNKDVTKPILKIKNYYEKDYSKISNKKKSDFARIQNNLQGINISSDDLILDIGCGRGDVCSYMSQKGAKVIGLDISLNSLLYSSQLKETVGFVQGNAEELPFLSSCFDKVTFMGVLEHFIHPDKALDEAKRVLKPKKYIVVLVPNSKFFLFKYFGGTGQIYEKPCTLEEWGTLLENQGLNIQKIYRDIGPGAFRDNILRGIIRKMILLITNLLPLKYTYQFVFICYR
jgi:ubiquinone/menaquinone biosynthesis C-methylase UbiE